MDKNTYQVWIDMLRAIGPSARTHRISVVVASMLQYAYEIYLKRMDNNEKNELGEIMLTAFETGYDEAQEWLSPVVKTLFMDAGLKMDLVSELPQKYRKL
ncbi:MAG: hypothetical protein A2381_15665 [Bdellovibrionales bacterium RIFOXYB1_FULL_37_110]|nr:MAG: hypothetical protein A2417_07515 [Bdellovibrionales bacterium RIFOXYC1_FULL_37_79]OFZ57057.1 MAG: hypothetical protein A2381_15665 [Bdellovibrionales bacterium RIFOXYB1_FULL_37_110]OFZ64889.1 MAG: hypothetical protein A2577_16935 [Bdellovibrionales bacterium RIFOXYD1_FULL_36_51]